MNGGQRLKAQWKKHIFGAGDETEAMPIVYHA